jgi:hypothetical protein
MACKNYFASLANFALAVCMACLMLRPMKLAAYLETNAIRPADFAEILGVDTSTVYRLKGDGQIPTPDLMRKIVDATDGAVRPDDFYGVAA